MDSKVNQGLKEFRWAFRRDATPRTAGAITKSGGGYVIADTATTAKVGDIYRPETATTAAMVDKEYKIIAASTNSFTIASKDLPVLGDTFYILGFVTPQVDEKGVISVSSSSGPTQYVYNGSDIEVALDTSTAANSRPLPVWYVNSGGTVTNLATETTLGSVLTSLQVIDDWDESDRAKVNLIVGQAGIAADGGATTASTIRVVNATDNPRQAVDLQTIKATAVSTNSGNADDGTQRVVIASNQGAIPASQSGTWNIGTVTSVTALASALPAGSNNIGDVDIASIAAGTNLIGFVSHAGQSGSTNALSSNQTTALAASLVIKAGAGRLYQLTGVNAGPAQYIQLHNTTTLPSNGVTPLVIFYVPSFGNFSFDMTPFGRYFSTGITVCNSSTAGTKTIGSADCWFNAEYL